MALEAFSRWKCLPEASSIAVLMPSGGFETGPEDSGVLWRIGNDYPRCSWFVINDGLTGIPNEKDHRWIILQKTEGEVSVPAFIRSRSNATGLLHPRHPEGHEPTCRIDEEGRIGGQRGTDRSNVPWAMPTRLLTAETYSCLEPYSQYVAAVQRMYLDWESGDASQATRA
jgi:hypothetical protein